MTLVVPPLSGAVAHDDPETLIGTLAPTGGAAPYEVIAIWPAGPANGFDPDRVALGIWRERFERAGGDFLHTRGPSRLGYSGAG